MGRQRPSTSGANEPKTKRSRRRNGKSAVAVVCARSQVSGIAFDMTKLQGYAGAACPVCYDDLGPKVPKGFTWDTVLVSEAQKKEDPPEVNDPKKRVAASNTRITQCLKNHVAEHHQHFPIWSVYDKLEVSDMFGRRKTAQRQASVTTCLYLISWVYKKVITRYPFDDVCVSTKAVAPAAVIELFHLRFGYTGGMLTDPRATTFWFKGKTTSAKEQQILIKGALALLSDHRDTFRETFDSQQQTHLCELTRDQIRNTVNNFFLWSNGQALSYPYFSG